MSTLILTSDLPNCVFNLEARNLEAHKVISSYASMHAAMDVGIGLAGLLPIPGAATFALIGAIAAQAPVVYEPMTKELAALYNASPDAITDRMQRETIALEAVADVGMEFLKGNR